nr:gibberellin-regulated protein 9-like [Ipomoea trifida]
MKLSSSFLIAILLLQVFTEALATDHSHKFPAQIVGMLVEEDAERRRERMCVVEHAPRAAGDATASRRALTATPISVPAMPSSRPMEATPNALKFCYTNIYIMQNEYLLRG